MNRRQFITLLGGAGRVAPQLRSGLFRFFWRGTAVLRTAELLEPLHLLSKRKPIVRNLFERPFEA
jgi:hypothetical protein